MAEAEARDGINFSYRIADPADREILIPADRGEDFAYFTIGQPRELRAYYDAYGYVVIRGLVSAEACGRARARYDGEVKPYRGFIYRQATANPERHAFTDHGFMLNSILNIQSLDDRHFSGFKRSGLEILADPAMQAACRAILGAPGKLVQSMYFEGNPATWPHQDTYYLDAEEIGRMTAAWIAVEDIAPGAGRFFVYPKSHLIDMVKNGGDFDIAFNHDRYKKLVIKVIRDHGLECRAPALQKGDVLFWAAKTIHGSLRTTQPHLSRSSFTAHYIPERSRFLQFQTRIKKLDIAAVGGMSVHRPKDLNQGMNPAVFWVETHFPALFQTAKKIAIKLSTR